MVFLDRALELHMENCRNILRTRKMLYFFQRGFILVGICPGALAIPDYFIFSEFNLFIFIFYYIFIHYHLAPLHPP